jgi:tetratricopeptide (TPR) repeat protein
MCRATTVGLLLSLFGMVAGNTEKSAPKLIAAADREFRNGAFDQAVRLYSEALAIDSSPRTLYARHKAYLKLAKLPSAIADLTSSLTKDPGFGMAYAQRANLLLLTGRCRDAMEDYQTVLRLDPTKRDAQARMPHAHACAAAVERAEYARRSGDWHTVREALNAAMEPEHATAAPSLMLQRAEANLRLGDLDNAVADAARVLKLEGGNTAAYALRATALSRLGDYANARTHYSECLHFDPEHLECKKGFRALKAMAKVKERGDAAMEAGRWADAAAAWQEGLSLGSDNPTWGKEALPKLARALWKKGDLDAADRAARTAIAADDGSCEAHRVLGEVLLQREAWEEASRQGHRAHECDRGSGEYRDLAQRAEAALKQSKVKNYYQILGVPRNADDGAVKKAYRAAARTWHPDMAKTAEEREAFEAKFRDIAEAYDVLTDAEKRGRYDRGEDVSGQPQGHPGHHGHPGGFPFPFGGPGGPGGPGGFTFTFRHG